MIEYERFNLFYRVWLFRPFPQKKGVSEVQLSFAGIATLPNSNTTKHRWIYFAIESFHACRQPAGLLWLDTFRPESSPSKPESVELSFHASIINGEKRAVEMALLLLQF